MESQRQCAIVAAVKYLSRADRTESELRTKLQRSGFGEDLVSEVLEWARGKNYFNDQRVAEREVELAKAVTKVGRRRVEARLVARGAEESVIASELSAYSESDELSNAFQLIQKKFKQTDDPAKIVRYLASKGFDEETVRSAVLQLIPSLEW